ncbi:hypothetical protein E1218_03500 [Kribbella turkmenica]|uniref:Uncharacterized protein n=1 Tax=Kribbella turkmenica TaxID=2530375 RepID=A0A4R4XFH0_9ACTN|nr:hypothetical protein [Kribbella turkmenica]TDD29648.1 hypothetical protein E1218_03500 [Kribbella turkmenica]
MEIADVGGIALALDGVKESRAGGLLRWTLNGRLVARQHDEPSIVVRVGSYAPRVGLTTRMPLSWTARWAGADRQDVYTHCRLVQAGHPVDARSIAADILSSRTLSSICSRRHTPNAKRCSTRFSAT